MKIKPVYTGLSGSFFLTTLYTLLLILIGGVDHAVSFITELWLWLAFIITGFGVQLGLYFFIRQKMRSRKVSPGVKTTMGVSTGSMILCCIHLAVDLLPFAGLSAIALSLTSYQTSFLLLGVLSNITGVIIMLLKIRKHHLISDKSLFNKINPKKLIVTLTITGFFSISGLAADEKKSFVGLPEKVVRDNRVVFSVKPEMDKNIRVYITMNTHSVNLDFDMMKAGYLMDGEGNKVKPVSWTGDRAGGHHRSGYLLFEYRDINTIHFIMKASDRFSKHNFKWEIQ